MALNCHSNPLVYQLSSELIDEICAGPGYGRSAAKKETATN